MRQQKMVVLRQAQLENEKAELVRVNLENNEVALLS